MTSFETGVVPMRNHWLRLSSALLAASALAAVGCNQTHAAPPVTQPQAVDGVPAPAAAPVAGGAALPPISTSTLPPTPVPATFDVAGLAEQVRATVVNITTTQKVVAGEGGGDPFDFFFGQRGQNGGGGRSMKRQALGTGFIIDAAGYVVTNEHVIHDADDVRVHLADDRELKAEVVGRDPRLDVALLKIKGGQGLPTAPLGSSEKLRVGEHVLAVGNPFGLGHTVTLGIVSAKARTIGAGPYDDFIQTDASINPGNSGGPLFNWRGEVIGINTAIRAGANGIGFAIPIDEVKDVLGQLRDKGHVERGRLGLGFQPLTPDLAEAMGVEGTKGALVSQLEAGGAAARAGIRAGDVILAINGRPIQHAEELPRRVAHNPPGSVIDVTLVRDKQRREIKATLDNLPDDPTPVSARPGAPPGAVPPTSAGKLGVQVSDAQGGGVQVDEIDGENVRDLTPGDVIIELNGAPVKDVVGLRAAMSRVKPGTTALLKVRRGRSTQYAAVPVPAK
jgi:serine protease Do